MPVSLTKLVDGYDTVWLTLEPSRPFAFSNYTRATLPVTIYVLTSHSQYESELTLIILGAGTRRNGDCVETSKQHHQLCMDRSEHTSRHFSYLCYE